MKRAEIEKRWFSTKSKCKPCPVCESQRICLYHYRRLKIVDIYFVSCEECGSSGKDRLTISGAIRAWNKHKRWKNEN